MASGGSIVICGNITFFNVLTRFFTQDFVRDESGTDVICQKFTLAITAHINALAVARTGMLPSSGTGDPAADLRAVRYLLADRQHFEYWLGCTFDSFGNQTGGTQVLVSDPANVAGSTNINLKDVANGPRVNVESVTRVSSDSLLRVDVEFEINQLQCTAQGTTGNMSGILNNRWAVVDDIDNNFFTTRTFAGQLRLSSSQVNGNNFRNLCIPPLQPGMRRDHIQIATTTDGLHLKYTVTDKEVAFAPPAPATTWSARFTERKSYEGQLGFFVDAEITLGGDRFVDKQKLFAIAASMALSKFQNGIRVFGEQDQKYYVQDITMIDEYGDAGSFIHLRATARRIDANEKAILGLPSRNLGVPIGPLNEIADVVANYDPRFSRDSRPGENIEVNGPIPLAGAFVAFLQSPCNQPVAIYQGLQPNQPPAPGGQALPTIVAVINNGIADDQTITAVYGNVNAQGMYTYWAAEVHTNTKANRVQLPVARTGSSSSSSADNWWNGTPVPPGTPAAVVIDLAPPTTDVEVTMAGERIGLPPMAPKPADTKTPEGATLKVGRVTTSKGNPRPTADGKYAYRLEVNMKYLVLDVVTFGISGFFKGLNPWSTTDTYTIPDSTTTDLYTPQ